MWIFTKHGFFSIVENRQDAERKTVLVRARCREDIESIRELLADGHLKTVPAAQETPDRDYRFRIVVAKHVMAGLLFEIAEDIDYGNFKGKVHGDPARDRAYGRCWQAMYDFQAASAS